MNPVRGQPNAAAEHEVHASNGVNTRQLLFTQFALLAIIASLYFLGFWLYLYWVFWWYDIVLHILGGAWVALAVLWLLTLFEKKRAWAPIIGIVILVGVVWELFEVAIGAPRESNFIFDTSLDLLMDVIGAAGGIVFVRRTALPRCGEK